MDDEVIDSDVLALITVRNARRHILVGVTLDEGLLDAARRLNATHTSIVRDMMKKVGGRPDVRTAAP